MATDRTTQSPANDIRHVLAMRACDAGQLETYQSAEFAPILEAICQRLTPTAGGGGGDA